ncbi:Riboflavin synthase [Zhongshania aliphaticivorans]|uniref:Riboflavin synthase n=1 Tax=Zhongshania aliphaticivorans TaxID=1470434 RepID=A0A5S9N8I6_9GAMM|nr:riboflavin synthase subunit alpha [Zhongshania aliphaticivorans]CAA0079209.1 Riboflavin synthase [Zhongshania aliphaticivorans]CAA0086314.1 Riboflavin synthase [Zhongshania aliphaticivorans]
MYTGIVHGAYPLVEVVRKPGLHQLFIDLPPVLLEDLTIGASVGLDGVCMTVTSIEDGRVSFDAMQETLSLTTLGSLDVGDRVNVERSAKQGAEIGGHNISGHVDGSAEIIAIEETANNCTIRFQLPIALSKYVFKKGFVGVSGCSLTVADYQREEAQFSVCLIPETLRVTTFAEKRVGDKVNIEVDRQTQVIVDTVERVLAERG